MRDGLGFLHSVPRSSYASRTSSKSVSTGSGGAGAGGAPGVRAPARSSGAICCTTSAWCRTSTSARAARRRWARPWRRAPRREGPTMLHRASGQRLLRQRLQRQDAGASVRRPHPPPRLGRSRRPDQRAALGRTELGRHQRACSATAGAGTSSFLRHPPPRPARAQDRMPMRREAPRRGPQARRRCADTRSAPTRVTKRQQRLVAALNIASPRRPRHGVCMRDQCVGMSWCFCWY